MGAVERVGKDEEMGRVVESIRRGLEEALAYARGEARERAYRARKFSAHRLGLSIQPHAQTSCSLAESVLAAFQNIADCFADLSVFEAARHIAN